MKKFILTCAVMIFSATGAFAAAYTTSTNWFDTKNINHLNTIGQNIIKANKMPSAVTFKVTDNDSMNATNDTSKEIYIYNGNLKYVENDNELAAVIAHELGHVINGHNEKQSLLYSAISSVNPNVSTEKGETTVNLIKSISASKISKDTEKEADITAVDLLMTAKYNPLALISWVYKATDKTAGGILDDSLSCEERVMNIYDYANYNYPATVKANYKTDSYQTALTLIYANLKIRNASSKKLAQAKKEQQKLQTQKLKRIRNMAKSTNPWSTSYSLLQLNTEK